ncbi:hypothetical protein A0J61_03086 [Choanephora cucurbitarum]|uniref:Uncharacterized protein n=1 Tax=Choanephora cucurbitarum TaxID=101091 RepID=A0A1C7NNM0_9FUNG|nr:hypothetical protein A0J61_03086 [Choanephora cucurbitarum]
MTSQELDSFTENDDFSQEHALPPKVNKIDDYSQSFVTLNPLNGEIANREDPGSERMYGQLSKLKEVLNHHYLIPSKDSPIVEECRRLNS